MHSFEFNECRYTTTFKLQCQQNLTENEQQDLYFIEKQKLIN